MPTPTERNITVLQGNQFRMLFTLTVRGVGPWNFAGASSVVMGIETGEGEILTPLSSDPDDIESDWENGKAAVLVPSTYTQVERSLRYTLTVSIGDEVKSVVTGTIFVERRPGYTPPP